MKALVCREFGPPESLVYDTLALPPVGPGDVRVAIRAAGVNFPDTLIIQGKYQLKPPMPFAPGGEFAGTVAEIGSAVTRFAVGQRVIGMTGFGGFAEEIVVPETRLMPLPPAMDFVTAAGFSMTYGTSMHALEQRAQIKPGETLVVLGASGGVGLAAVELGKIMGARVLAVGGDDAKLAHATRHGADAVLNYSTHALKEGVMAFTGGRGANVIYDAVGGDIGEQALRCLAWGGRLLIVGFAAGRIPQIPANLLLLKGASAVGVFWGDFRQRETALDNANFERLFAWHAEGKLKPHVAETFALPDAAEALNALLSRRVVGKVVVTID